MAGRRRLERKTDDRRPVVTDDFIYDDQQDSFSGNKTDSVSSDTPEEAIRKLKDSARRSDQDPDSAEVPPDVSRPAESVSQPDNGSSSEPAAGQDSQPVPKSRKKLRQPHPVIRGIILTMVTFSLLLSAGAFVFHRINPQTPYLGIPEKLITVAVTPVQSLFSGISETVFGYFREMNLRANIQTEYNALIQNNEQLVYKAMEADQLLLELAKYQKLSDEVKANQDMKPLDCRIIGKSDSTYFSTLTIDKGKADGVTDDMAVTYDNSLIGYTYNTTEHTSTVITIINTDASIEALIQSTRDQGKVSGTLAINGKPQCRMNYTPDVSLPRPGDQVVTSGIGKPFPKGLLIGTVEESTRGNDENEQYIVLNPSADFQHLDHVTVLLYRFFSGEESQSGSDASGYDSSAETEDVTYTEPEGEQEMDSDNDSVSAVYDEFYEEPYDETDPEPGIEPDSESDVGSDTGTEDESVSPEREDEMDYESDF